MADRPATEPRSARRRALSLMKVNPEWVGLGDRTPEQYAEEVLDAALAEAAQGVAPLEPFDNTTEACRHCPTPDVHPMRIGGVLTYEGRCDPDTCEKHDHSELSEGVAPRAEGLDEAWGAVESALPQGAHLTAIFEVWDKDTHRIGHRGLIRGREDAAAALNDLARSLSSPSDERVPGEEPGR